MNHSLHYAVSAEDLAAVDAPIESARGMPNAAYTQREFHAFERDHVFARTWAALAYRADHATPGTVSPVDFMGIPLLITCDTDGTPAVFHNVCSHRGRRLLNGPKKTNGMIVCPYHSWSYDLGGALRATPHIGGEGVHEAAGFERERHGLKAVRSHCWLGILFINLDGNAPPFEEHAAPLTDHYRRYLGDNGAADLHAAESGMSLELGCNWKLAVENYCEAYHLPWIHPGLNSYSPLKDHECMYLSEAAAGQRTHRFTPTIAGAEHLPCFPDWPEAQRSIAEYPAFYPNLLLGFQVNHVFAMIIHPLAAEQVREEVRLFYIGEGASAERHRATREANLESWREVFIEDVEAVEGMQHGRHSPGFRGGAFSPVMDGPTHHFHRWVARQYRAGYAALAG